MKVRAARSSAIRPICKLTWRLQPMLQAQFPASQLQTHLLEGRGGRTASTCRVT